jgi:hypothetical protein
MTLHKVMPIFNFFDLRSVKFLSRSGRHLVKVYEFLCKVDLDLVVTLAQCGHHVVNLFKQEFNMSSTFKKALKKPDWKTLKFPGEEKSRRAITLCAARGSQKFPDRVSPLTALVVGFKKETCVNARHARKRKSNEVQISPAMTNNIQ